MSATGNIFRDFQSRFFQAVVSKRLVYNTCWEDPHIDRQLLQIRPDSDIVMLTSAGCNALDYLLDNPGSIHSIDVNPAQNAVLELKRALFINSDFPTLWSFFGKGSHPAPSHLYHRQLSASLSTPARRFWERHINYFISNPVEPSFYFRGTSGKVALMMHNRIRHKGLYRTVLNLLNSGSMDEQQYFFEEAEDQLWNTFYRWLLSRNLTLALLGVPATQRDIIDREHEGGLVEFIQTSMQNVFTEIPVRDNYFWRVYLTGSYTRNCRPNYLKEENFDILAQRVSKIKQHTCYLSQFLRRHPGSYSHFILLDHQDWLAHAQPELLAEEWKLILQNSRPGARILFRSAGSTNDFLPDFVFQHVDFESVHEKAASLHQQDRVGTYGSTHLGVVRP